MEIVNSTKIRFKHKSLLTFVFELLVAIWTFHYFCPHNCGRIDNNVMRHLCSHLIASILYYFIFTVIIESADVLILNNWDFRPANRSLTNDAHSTFVWLVNVTTNSRLSNYTKLIHNKTVVAHTYTHTHTHIARANVIFYADCKMDQFFGSFSYWNEIMNYPWNGYRWIKYYYNLNLFNFNLL